MRNGLLISEEDILAKLKRGDNDAWERLYREIRPTVVRHILMNSGSKDEANEIFQKAINDLLCKIVHDRLTLSSSIKTYLFEVCRRLWLKELRQRKRFANLPDDMEDTEEPSSEIPQPLTRPQQLALQCLSELHERCRSVLHHFSMDVPMEQIALMVGLANEDAAKTMKFKCKKKVLECVKKRLSHSL